METAATGNAPGCDNFYSPFQIAEILVNILVYESSCYIFWQGIFLNKGLFGVLLLY